MSTKKEKCCGCPEEQDICRGECMCHHSQSESIEWEKVAEDDIIDKVQDCVYGLNLNVAGDEYNEILQQIKGSIWLRGEIRRALSQAITTAVAKERQRILGLPCMEREEAPEEVHDLDNQLELINGLANFNWNSGRNFLRRELKEEINI